MIVKKTLKFTTKLLAVILIIATLISGVTAFAASKNTKTLHNAPELYEYVRKGYNGGTKGPIIITKATLQTKGGSGKQNVFLVSLVGLQPEVKYQATSYFTCLKVGLNLPNDYFDRASAAILKNKDMRFGDKIIFAGHSLGGMVAQQLAANPAIQLKFKVLNTVTFGSPLIAAGFREGKIQRLCHVQDLVPILSTNSLITPVHAYYGLNREGNENDYDDWKVAHSDAYGTDANLFKDYDVLGYKGGNKVLVLNLNYEKFYKAPCYLGLPY